MRWNARNVKRADFHLICSKVMSCHRVKDEGDIQFVVEILKTNEIRRYYERKEYAQAFYLLAMVDYLSRENALPLYSAYDDLRKQKLEQPV